MAMPQITREARHLIAAETTLWNATELLNQIENAGEFHDRIEAIGADIDRLAQEMGRHNEQFIE